MPLMIIESIYSLCTVLSGGTLFLLLFQQMHFTKYKIQKVPYYQKQTSKCSNVYISKISQPMYMYVRMYTQYSLHNYTLHH